MESRGSFRYPMVRGSGAFLVLLGLGIATGALWPGAAPMNMRIFFISVILGMLAIPVTRHFFPLGKPTRFHILVMTAAVAFEFVSFLIVFPRLAIDTPVQTRWIWAFLIVGVHFIPMGLALGKRIVFLGLACILVAITGLLFDKVPFVYFAALDGLLKICFGVSMVSTSLKLEA